MSFWKLIGQLFTTSRHLDRHADLGAALPANQFGFAIGDGDDFGALELGEFLIGDLSKTPCR